MANNYFKVSVCTNTELGGRLTRGTKKNYHKLHLPVGDLETRKVYSWVFPFDDETLLDARVMAEMKFNDIDRICADEPVLTVWRRYPGCKCKQIGVPQ